MRRTILLGILLLLPGPLRAQEGRGDSPATPRAGSAAAFLIKSSEVAGTGRYLVGGWAGLVFGDHFALGGGGVAITEDVELQGSGSTTGFYLGGGYGGILLKYWGGFSYGFTGEAGLLLGAGQAEVRDGLSGHQVGAENFLVMEPEISLFYNLYRQVYLGASGGYRFTSSLEDLPRVSPHDLQSFTATLSLRLGGR